MIEIICKNLDDTKKLAQKFAKLVETNGCFVNLYGEIGAGKTAFVKEVAKAIGIEEKVTSPTFVILNEYHGGKLPMYHFDLYRLHSFEELINVGAEEFLYSNGISILEWPECVGLENFPDYAIMVTILKLDEFKREIVIRRN